MRAPGLLLLALSLTVAAAARAAPPVPGIRPLGMGGALRGAATGDAGPALNPSGILLLRSYIVEGAYSYSIKGRAHNPHVSIVDSTSGFNIGGGVYYTYLAASPEGGAAERGHEGGMSLALPLGDRIFLGATGKYLTLKRELAGQTDKTTGLTVDLGLTVRVGGSLSLGVVGHNLRDLEDARAPRGLGGGAAVTPMPDLVLALDGVLDFTSADPARGNVVTVGGGGEYVIGKRVGVRAGGGRDGVRSTGFASAGVSLLAEIGALDFAVQQELGGARETIMGASARLFVPSP